MRISERHPALLQQEGRRLLVARIQGPTAGAARWSLRMGSPIRALATRSFCATSRLHMPFPALALPLALVPTNQSGTPMPLTLSYVLSIRPSISLQPTLIESLLLPALHLESCSISLTCFIKRSRCNTTANGCINISAVLWVPRYIGKLAVE